MKLNAKARLLQAAAKPVMYHVTLKENVPSIMKNGLTPAKKPKGFSGNKSNWVKNAIYFTSSPRGARDWIIMLSGDDDVDVEAASKFTILKVDLSDWYTKLREDPDWNPPDDEKTDAYYLVGVTIPPQNIKQVNAAQALSRIKTESKIPQLWAILEMPQKELRIFLSGLSPMGHKKVRKEWTDQVKRTEKYYKMYPIPKRGHHNYKGQIEKEANMKKLDKELTQVGV